jgi:tetratricopeptide (TPR) repeat protein
MPEVGQNLSKLKEAYRLLRERKYEESEAMLRPLQTSEEAGPRAKSALGIIHLQKGDHRAAEHLFRSVIASGHKVAEAHYGIGVISEASDPGYARAHYEIALSISPNHVGAQNRIRRLNSAKQSTTSTQAALDETSLVSAQATPSGRTATEKAGEKAGVIPAAEPASIGRRSKLNYGGIAKNVKSRTEQRGSPPRQVQIIEFVLQREIPLTPVPVYMAGYRAEGILREGDQVVLEGKRPKAGSNYRTNRVKNLSTGGDVVMSGLKLSDRDPARVLSYLILLGIVIGGALLYLASR